VGRLRGARLGEGRWAGPPIETIFNEKPRSVGRFWSPAYRQAWAQLQQQLARALRQADGDPGGGGHQLHVLHGRAVRRADPGGRAAEPLRAAGFTDAAYKDCLGARRRDYAPPGNSRGWCCRQSLAHPRPSKATATRLFTEGLMRDCRQTIVRRCVCSTTTISILTCRGRFNRILRTHEAARSGNRIPDLADDAQDFDGTIRLGVSYGASSIELVPGLRRLAAGAGRQAQAMGDHAREDTGVPAR